MKLRTAIALATLFGVLGCNETPVDDPPKTGCGPDGLETTLPTARDLCVYRWPIVIETGFSCPAARPNQFDFPEQFAACASFTPLRQIEIEFLRDRFGHPDAWLLREPSPQVELVPVEGLLDILWVIDNSGSMGQEQRVLRENFGEFIAALAERDVDLHVAVTTTQLDEYVLEPVALPGAIQAVPQPIPGFDQGTHLAVDEMGQPILGDYTPVRDAIAAAVDCMATPDESWKSVTNADIECALYGAPAGCSIAGRCGGATPCEPQDLFPDPSTYRPIPKVLKTTDHIVDGTLDMVSLQQAFACMSLVGTRGYGVEKGLGAAIRAVSPELTDGTNAGFLRENARFAVMFVTDENDCTHDGTLDETGLCGADVCEFANLATAEDSPLRSLYDLKLELLANLSASKGREVRDEEVFVGSIHGQANRFEGPVPEEKAQCAADDYQGISPSCATPLGVAYTGDRYERFLLQFTPGNFFPEPEGPDALMAGWMCRGDFSPALGALGEWLAGAVAE